MLEKHVHFITVDPELVGQRLDNFLLGRYKTLPKSHLYRIIRKGEVRVNKKRIDPHYRLQAGDQIRMPPLYLEETLQPVVRLPTGLARQLTQQILYEDAQLLVLNKPAGLAVHAGSGVRLGVIEALRLLRPQEKYLELVHRLDRETSGCLLIAKKPSVLRECHALLREGSMSKSYLLLVKGYWPAHLRYVDEALDRNQLRGGERMVKVAAAGKSSQTVFRVRQRYAQVTLMEAQPQTGRTHQIRVHAAHVNFPLVGDDKYGDKTFNKLMRAYGCERLFLHAASLTFALPSTGKRYQIEAPLAEDLERCLQRVPVSKKA